MTDLVVDASVTLKWYLDEDYATEARRLVSGEFELVAPDLIFAEAANALWKRIVRREMTVEEAAACVEALAAVPLTVFEMRPLLGAALQLAANTMNTVYDCLYLALAIHCGCPLITADRRFFIALAGTEYAPAVLWVGDVKVK